MRALRSGQNAALDGGGAHLLHSHQRLETKEHTMLRALMTIENGTNGTSYSDDMRRDAVLELGNPGARRRREDEPY